MLINLVDVLKIMEIGSVNIFGNDSSFLEANQIMEFVFAKIQDNQSIIAKRMHELLVKIFDKPRAPPALRNSLSVVAKQWFLFRLSKALWHIERSLYLPLLIWWNYGNRQAWRTSTSIKTGISKQSKAYGKIRFCFKQKQPWKSVIALCYSSWGQ